MTQPPLADSIQKLKEHYPDSPRWILDRADAIAKERLKKVEEDAFKEGAKSVLSLKFLVSVFESMGEILMAPWETRKPIQRGSLQNDTFTVGRSFEWAFENSRRATADYITEHNVPLQIFTQTERRYLFPNGTPTHDQASVPETPSSPL